MSEKLIDVKNISFSYSKDSPLIFEDISFSIEKGDILCVLGPNGTGKTTLIKLLLNAINIDGAGAKIAIKCFCAGYKRLCGVRRTLKCCDVP